MFLKRYSVTILDSNWVVIKDTIKVKYIPRADELIYISEYSEYYKIINVVHNLENGKHGIFLIVTKNS